MIRVAASEALLLTVARGLSGQIAPESVASVLRGAYQTPDGIGPTCRRLLEATLARGAVYELARRGGWRRSRQIASDGAPGPTGRVWERHTPPELRFTKRSMHLLRWLCRAPLATASDQRVEASPSPETLALGDELLLYLACDLLERTGCGAAIGRERAFAASPLCWIGFPHRLASRFEREEDPRLPAFAPLVSSPGVILLEALQADLATRWIAIERSKRKVRRIAAMRALGQAQERVLTGFLDAASAASRRDLASFLVEAARELLSHPPPARSFVESLEAQATIRDRTAAHHAAGAFLRGISRLAGWLGETRGARFFDEGYAAAQLLLAEWEFLGERGQESASALLRQLDALDATAAAPEPSAEEERSST